MRIAYIHTNDLAKNETSETFVIQHANSLAETGAEVRLFLLNSSEVLPAELIKSKFGWAKLHPNLKVKCFAVKGKSKRKYYSWSAQQIEELEASFVITRHHGVLNALLSSRQKQHLYFFETHDFFMDLGIRDDVSYKKRWKQWLIERIRFPKLDGLLHLNTYQYELYNERLPDIKKGIFPTGLVKQRVTGNGTKKRVVYIGSLNPRLGLSWLVDLAANFPDDHEFYIVAGKTQQEIDYFIGMFEGKSLPKNVTITGWVNKERLGEIMSEARVGLLPLADTFFNRFLTVPLKLLDYLAFGTPVLASKMPCIEEFIEEGKNGYFVDWSDRNKLIDKIKDITENQNTWKEMQVYISKQVEGLLWSKRAQAEVKFLNQVKVSKEKK
jgi:glycosyltransferase involved in cell wall biosynthesis